MAEGTRAWFSERRNLSKRSEVANRERRAFFNTKSELQLVRESLRELSQLVSLHHQNKKSIHAAPPPTKNTLIFITEHHQPSLLSAYERSIAAALIFL